MGGLFIIPFFPRSIQSSLRSHHSWFYTGLAFTGTKVFIGLVALTLDIGHTSLLMRLCHIGFLPMGSNRMTEVW